MSVKLLKITDQTSQGANFVFDQKIGIHKPGGILTNEWWFSWESIASKMIGQEVECKEYEPEPPTKGKDEDVCTCGHWKLEHDGLVRGCAIGKCDCNWFEPADKGKEGV